MDAIYKEVYFYQYCKTCKYCDYKETDDPCDECLTETMNEYSHRPVNWKEKEK